MKPRPKLLAIVDDWENLERYEEKLSPAYEVSCAPFGNVGLEMAREERPDLILLDLVLEDMTPDEALQGLRGDSHTARIPVVAIGTHLKRPFTYDQLLEALQLAHGEKR